MGDLQHMAFEQSGRDSELSSRCLLTVFAYLGRPKSFVDYGCGPGHLVELAYKLGAHATGVDLHVENYNSYGCTLIQYDLTEDIIDFPSEMVVCWELAEHLPETSADDLCHMLTISTEKYLLFSAAVDDQGGAGHINEQSHFYWIEKLEQRGLSLDETMTRSLRKMFGIVAPDAWWYGQNLLVFTKEQ